MSRAIVWGALAVGAFLLLTRDGPRMSQGPVGRVFPQLPGGGHVVTGVQGAGIDVGSGLEAHGGS